MLLSVIFLTYLINKPPATVCSHDPQTSRATSIYDLLPPSPLKLHTVGRLDKDTTGALLITNDTKLVDFGTVSGHVEKVYEAKTMGILTEDQLDQLRTGVDLQGGLGFSDPCPVSVVSHEAKTTILSLTLHQGKNRQIRRMLHSVGSGVIKLRRVSIGTLTCNDLQEGEYRKVTHSELQSHLSYNSPI